MKFSNLLFSGLFFFGSVGAQAELMVQLLWDNAGTLMSTAMVDQRVVVLQQCSQIVVCSKDLRTVLKAAKKDEQLLKLAADLDEKYHLNLVMSARIEKAFFTFSLTPSKAHFEECKKSSVLSTSTGATTQTNTQTNGVTTSSAPSPKTASSSTPAVVKNVPAPKVQAPCPHPLLGLEKEFVFVDQNIPRMQTLNRGTVSELGIDQVTVTNWVKMIQTEVDELVAAPQNWGNYFNSFL